MNVLLVHGMNRTARSMRRLGEHLRERTGAGAEYFGYGPAFETVASMEARLGTRLVELAARGPYAVVGHSLGGLLLRSAIHRLPPGTPRPLVLVMLGTPNRPPLLARRFHRSWLYRLVNGDAGQFLASGERMAAVPLPTVPCLLVAGSGGSRSPRGPFRGAENDGVVAVEEARLPDGIGATVVLPVGHTFMMNRPEGVDAVVRAVAEAVAAAATAPPPARP